MLTKNTDVLRKEVSLHLAQDALIKGSYWYAAKNHVGGKGCFIGCLTHSGNPTPAFERFGLPIAVLRIAENIFEALPDDEGKAFFAALPDAVECDGKDLSRVHWAFVAAELRALPEVNYDTQVAVDMAISGMGLLAAGKDWPKDTATRANEIAVKATYTADSDTSSSAAYAVVRATEIIAKCTDAAYVVSCITNHTTDAAASVDANYGRRAAAYTACRIRQRDTLLRLIVTAPVPAAC